MNASENSSAGQEGQHGGDVSAEAATSGEDPGATLLFHLELEKYDKYIAIVGFVTFIALLLLIFHESALHKLANKLPESLILILLGVACALLAQNSMSHYYNIVLSEISAATFFNVLLPVRESIASLQHLPLDTFQPIILDSAYQLYCKQFVMNVDGILLLALLGTTLNIFAIGFSLYFSCGTSKGFTILECLLLSAMISAVDPVRVGNVMSHRWPYFRWQCWLCSTRSAFNAGSFYHRLISTV